MSERILGLDIGISSLGWAVIDYDKNNSLNNKIIKSGVRIFTIAENPKTGESLALPRRNARASRRTIKRKKQRIKGIKNLLVKYLDFSKDEIFSPKNIFNEKKQKDVWQLRDKSLKRELTNKEFARVLMQIAKRRGYKSNRKVEEKENSEGKKVLSSIEKNKKLLNNYLTIGQAIYQTTKETKTRRNKKDDYNHSISRDMLVDEINIIFEKQKEFKNPFVSDNLKQEYLELFLKQRDFASVDKMVGFCTLEGKPNKRAAKASYSAELFVTLTKLINTKIIDSNHKERSLTKEELEKIILLCHQSEQPTYLKIKEIICLDESSHFKNVSFYEIDKKTGEVSKKTTKFISGFKGFHSLRKVVEKTFSKTYWQNIAQDKKLLNDIATIFSHHKSDEKINNELQKLEIKILNESEKQILIKALIENIHFDKFLNLSIKAIDKLLKYMLLGKRYDEAVDLCKYKKVEGTKQKFLRALNKDEQFELTNPVVKRALSQTRKVVNALIRVYGQFDKINIELTREIKKSHSDRKKIEKAQDEYQTLKQGIVKNFIENFGKEPRGNELLKYRLWQEQGERCIYSGKEIDIKRLISEVNYAQIDHILPFSRSLEDGMINKVICLSKENQDKKNRTPYEYFTHENKDWHWFEEFVKSLKNIKKGKRDRLLKKNFDENSEIAFRDRNANDTAFMSRFIKDFIENNLELKSKDKQKVFTRSGTLTNMLRHNWGIGNKSRDNHLHHAVDALIVAFSTQSEVQRLSTLSAKIDGFTYEKSEKKAGQLKFVPPIEHFRDEVQKSIDDIFVSFAPRRGVKGAAHKETIYSKKAEKKKGTFEINNGLAENGEVKRVDIFKKDGKYHFIFLYPSDFLKKELPLLTIKGIEIDDSFEFIFSLFKDEYIEIKQKNKEPHYGYLKFVESDGRFNVLPHFQSQLNKKDNRISTGSVEYIKKYQVDVLGNTFEIKREKRVGTKKQR
ncbi:CRISPR-associated endonuclease Csn1 [Malaciobacter marinus]|jgi:CRISPR-associated endonuclease Csn1|uniref:CRISPR-associated endonuclease Cas9 n=1 Tax=Malaciobacter marinus TaxID=505249 RepID=A0AB36ZXM4_9BACT|nr:type II CRISPR RNA-guided endonuclease Cas9 [Malaciobacter marinus]PPK61428.1 CRISPR-associated endonuclease Csn1 [Malaciobacter marinus]